MGPSFSQKWDKESYRIAQRSDQPQITIEISVREGERRECGKSVRSKVLTMISMFDRSSLHYTLRVPPRVPCPRLFDGVVCGIPNGSEAWDNRVSGHGDGGRWSRWCSVANGHFTGSTSSDSAPSGSRKY